jgi:hypothetical protein
VSYLLSSTTIKAPNALEEGNSTQYAQQRTLKGTVNRDYFGSNKRIWTLDYGNTKKVDFDTINTIYQAYLNSGTAVSWQVTEANYTVSSTTVHIELIRRKFSQAGSDYISDFSLILTEA